MRPYVVALALAFVLSIRAEVGAQVVASVSGRVVGADTSDGIVNATVELLGHGSMLTNPDGLFRFEGVLHRDYVLRVSVLGHASQTRVVAVRDNVFVEMELEIAPVVFDPIRVESRTIDIEGHVRDPTRDLDLVDAEVITYQREPVWTGSRGRFSLERVVADVPLRLVVRAFGYFPLDTLLLPNEDESYVFELDPDPLVERMIDAQVDRIEARASPRLSVSMRPMNRERLLRYAGRHTVATMLEWEYGNRIRGIKCVVIDEKQLLGAWQPETLFHILPEQLERVEIIYPGTLRLYTREFMREMISREVTLRIPTFFGRPHVDPLCT